MLEKLAKLVSAFEGHYDEYMGSSYNETELRNDFVNPFFEILGWDVLNRKNLPQHLREVKHEASVYVEENGIRKKKKPDYAFHLGSEVCFYLETKKPSVDIVTSRDSVYQLRRYGWNGNLLASVLTNFADLLIYDCTIRPQDGEDSTQALVAHFHYTEYVDKYTDICDILSRDAVMSGRFERTFSSLSSPLKKEPFNQYFLEQIREWRYLLGKDIWEHNIVEEEELNIFVQKILNRIIFLRICEDRNLEVYGTLKQIATYEDLRKVFRRADKKYDSGLFHILEDQELQISDIIWKEILEGLYYPKSCYEFSMVDPYIIGQIYELFLEEKVHIQKDRISMEKKPEIVAAQGVVNTPKNVADRIVKETLDSKWKVSGNRSTNFKVADICCGSGNFLLSAYEYMMNQTIEEYRKEDEEKAVREGKICISGPSGFREVQNFRLSFREKRRIAESCIYGVDIDALAVEVAKFSLLLKLIEGCTLEEMKQYALEGKVKILPDLDRTIRCGNSLVDSHYLSYNSNAAYEEEQLFRLRMFDWEREFPGILFDAIVGNPPYVRVQNMVHYSKEEYDYYKWEDSPYWTAQADLLDKYYLFLERGLSLLREDGVLGYILPHKFMSNKTGSRLRSYLADRRCIKKILHMGTEQVFSGRSTYTCLLFLSKQENEKFTIGFVRDLPYFYSGGELDLREYPTEILGDGAWSFLSDDVVHVLDKIKARCEPLGQLAEIFVGLQTSADMIYIIEEDKQDEDYLYFKDKAGQDQMVEKKILRPCIYDLALEKYNKITPNRYLIFPYHRMGKSMVLYTAEEMKAQFPHGYHYFCAWQEELKSRSIKNMNGENWFQFGRSQSLRRFDRGEHLLWPVLSREANYVYDDTCIAFTGGGNGPYYGLERKGETKESLFYLQAVLNHWFLESIVKSRASSFRGDYYSHGKQFIEKLPIRRIDFTDERECDIHDEISERVSRLMQFRELMESNRETQRRRVMERMMENENRALEGLITGLYEAEEIRLEEKDEGTL